MASRRREDNPWYFACLCGLSFFDTEQTVACPRCREQLKSLERISPPSQKKSLYSVKEVCEMLSVKKSWLYARTGRKEIDHHKLGGIKFTEGDIAKLLEESKETKMERDNDRRKPNPTRPKLRHIRLP